MAQPAKKASKDTPVSYATLRSDADAIEALVKANLEYIENDQPINTPLMNILGDLSHLRDAVRTAEGTMK